MRIRQYRNPIASGIDGFFNTLIIICVKSGIDINELEIDNIEPGEAI